MEGTDVVGHPIQEEEDDEEDDEDEDEEEEGEDEDFGVSGLSGDSDGDHHHGVGSSSPGKSKEQGTGSPAVSVATGDESAFTTDKPRSLASSRASSRGRASTCPDLTLAADGRKGSLVRAKSPSEQQGSPEASPGSGGGRSSPQAQAQGERGSAPTITASAT